MNTTVPDVDELTLGAQIGQMLCLGWGGEDCLANVNAQARWAVTEAQAGGVILMGRNVQAQTPPSPPDVYNIRAMTDELQNLAACPLLVATDQEGGRVERLRGGLFSSAPSAQVLGAAGDTDAARAWARQVGGELREVGINFNFAPVADVNSNPQNPVIGDRSFGADADVVAAMVTAQVAGYADSGVLACAKHFPGHGDTSQDSHFDLPSLPFTEDEMERRELIPFRAAIAAGAPAIMTAHILFPALEPAGLPATLSHAILTGLLRDKLGFDGLIITDCLEMKAVRDHWGTPRAAVLAAVAGADMLLICHTEERQRATVQALLEAVATGELPLSRVRDAARRVLDAKRRIATARLPLDLSHFSAKPKTAPAIITTLGAEAVA